MSKLTDCLEQKTRKEIRYARGMEVMQRERYLEYCHDLRRARMRGDTKRVREIIQDLAAFVQETTAVMHQRRAAFDRLLLLRHGAHPHAAIDPVAAQQPLTDTITLFPVRPAPAHADAATPDAESPPRMTWVLLTPTDVA
jgi:hypothetical protein